MKELEDPMSKSAVSKIKTNDSGSGDEDMPVCVVAVCCSVLQCVALCCSVLQCVAVCCSVLQCVAAWHACPQIW